MDQKHVCFFLLVFAASLAFVLATTDYEDEDYEDYDDDEDFLSTNSTSNNTLVFTKALSNITRKEGKLVKFICEVQNLDPNNTNKIMISWKSNKMPIEVDDKDLDKRIKIRMIREKDHRLKSILRIQNVELFDKGFIDCIATNGVDRIKSTAVLMVEQELSPKWSSTSVINTLKRESTDPYSDDEITTFLPNAITKAENPSILSTVPSKSKTFEFDMEDSTGIGSKMIEKIPIYNGSEPFCQIYKGRACKSFLSNKYVFVQPPYTQEDIEHKIAGAFGTISTSNDISASCSKFAQPSVCFSAFPLCLDAKHLNSYQKTHLNEFKRITNETREKFRNLRKKLTNELRRICRDECILLENELCSREYSIAKRHPVIGQIMELEVCENLPVEMDPSSKHCLSLGVGDFKGNKDEKCYWDAGKLYRGVQNRTVTGEDCIRWSHQFHYLPSDYPELAGHNYCRNPGDSEDEPFCYVEQNRKEVCGISKCVHVFSLWVIVIILGITGTIGIILVYCYCKRQGKMARNLQIKDLPQVNKNIYGNPGPSSPIELNSLLPPNNLPTVTRSHNSSKTGYQNLPQYTYKEVRFIKELGEGAFGKVYQGELKTKNGKIFVAVKSLKENASAKTQADFQREIELISELKHPNIICLLGVVTKQEPMCMLFEYMSEGDLHEFLISNSPENGKCLTHDQFLDMAIQIAQGMDYLSGNHYVHRDLAARNCLVSKDLEVKISDFGLSRDMYSCDYYRVQSKSLLPVRWMPPESILYGKFTTESDVWSYGVVLWEIYSYGLQPYYGYNNQEVINMIRSRKLLPCPDACPSYCYSLMVECWAELANRRPNFSEIAHRLRVWKQSGTTNGAYFKSAPPSCQPTPQKYGNSLSKSSHTSESQLVSPCGAPECQPTSYTWEREHPKPSSSRLHDSQSSLASKSSTTQSTNISNEGRREKRRKNNVDSLERTLKNNMDSLERSNPKNMVVSASNNGDGFHTKIEE